MWYGAVMGPSFEDHHARLLHTLSRHMVKI